MTNETVEIDNPCYHCYAGAISECYGIGCKGEVLTVGSVFNKGLNSRNKFLEEEVEKYRNMVFDKMEILDKAKELLTEFIKVSESSDEDFPIDYAEIQVKAEQFLKGGIK